MKKRYKNAWHLYIYVISVTLSSKLLFRNPSFDANDKTKMINPTITYVLSTKRLDGFFYKEFLSYFYSFLNQTTTY